MSQVARYGKSIAHSGRGDELAHLLLAAAAQLHGDAGCELYLVNRDRADSDTIWVTELWRSQADLDASIEQIKGSPEVAAVLELVDRWEMIELDLLGGKGAAAPAERDTPPAAPATPPSQPDAPVSSRYTVHRLSDSEDAAVKHGYGAIGEARFVTGDLGAEQTGVSHHRIRPGARQAFGHRHERAEEVYVVLSGAGRVKLDDGVEEIATLDAIRVAAPVARAFEAGPDGLELLAFGPRHDGDGELLMGWWSD